MQSRLQKTDKTVAVNIRRLREQRGLTQKQLADKLFVSDNVVSKWERGESLPDPETLALLARIFEVEPGEIVYDAQDARTHGPSDRTPRRLPMNVFSLLCMAGVVLSSVILFALSVKAYIRLPGRIGIHFGPDGEIDLYGRKGMLFLCPGVSAMFAIAALLLNFIKIRWKVNLGVFPVYLDDLCKEEGNRIKIHKLLSAGLNATLLAAQSLFVLLGCYMALQRAVPVAAMWSIVCAVILVPVVFVVASIVKINVIRESERECEDERQN